MVEESDGNDSVTARPRLMINFVLVTFIIILQGSINYSCQMMVLFLLNFFPYWLNSVSNKHRENMGSKLDWKLRDVCCLCCS